MMSARRILVLGEDTQSFLSVIRSLGRAGMEVHVAWCPADSAALSSRYIARVHTVAPYRADSDAWMAGFQDLFRREHFDLVIPMTDGATLPFQLHRDAFESLARIYLLPLETYRTCANKDATWDLAQRLQIPVPRQKIVSNVDEALEVAELFGYPLVLKPRASAHQRNPLKRQQVEKAADRSKLIPLVEAMTADDTILAQENFIGAGAGVEVLCSDGRILIAFEHERVHEPMKGGGSSYRKSVPLDPEMLAATARLMQALHYTGVAMVEYKRNPQTGRWVLIEINARFWGSLALSVAAGLDFPRALVELLLDGREDFPGDYRTGIYCRHWSRDLQWMLQNRIADKRDPTLQSRSFSSVLLEGVNVLTLRERSDTFTFDDPRPGWHDLRLFVGEKLFRAVKLLPAYRRRERARLARLYQRADRIIVLCYGNICRSPFAGELLSSRLGRNAVSRGLYPRDNRRSPPEAVAAAAGRGIDLSRHGSVQITAEEIYAADLILIFDRRNWLGLRALAPGCMERVVYLGAADPAQSLEIADPYGDDLAGFDRCYGRIEDAFARLERTRRARPAPTRV